MSFMVPATGRAHLKQLGASPSVEVGPTLLSLAATI